MKTRKLKSHFRSWADVQPGLKREVKMVIDTGRPPWVTFRVKGSRHVFVMPLSEFVTLGIRRAQVRYVETKLGTEKNDAVEGTDVPGPVRDAPLAG